MVVQKSRKREIDRFVYKYVGVSGVDMPRIVEVGYRTDSLFADIARKNLALATALRFSWGQLASSFTSCFGGC